VRVSVKDPENLVIVFSGCVCPLAFVYSRCDVFVCSEEWGGGVGSWVYSKCYNE
jgi:hypothetical protein